MLQENCVQCRTLRELARLIGEPEVLDIIRCLAMHSMQSTAIADYLELATSSISKRLGHLRDIGLVDTIRYKNYKMNFLTRCANLHVDGQRIIITLHTLDGGEVTLNTHFYGRRSSSVTEFKSMMTQPSIRMPRHAQPLVDRPSTTGACRKNESGRRYSSV